MKAAVKENPTQKEMEAAINAANIVTSKRDMARAELERRQKEDSRMVKGIFRMHEPPGGEVSFPFRAYKEPIKQYTFKDGQEYEIPLAVAKHLNKNCNYTTNTYILGPDGKPDMQQAGKVRSRMNFESLDFWG